MKIHKRINYYHNRHRSDGALIENQRKRIENQDRDGLILSNKYKDKDKEENINNSKSRKKKSKNKDEGEVNLTEENIRNNNSNNSFYSKNIFEKDESYLNIEYFQSSNNLAKNLSFFYKVLSKPLTKFSFSKKEKNNKEFTEKQLEEENLLLAKENYQLEQEINLLQKNISYNNLYDSNKQVSQGEIEQLYYINQKLMRENEYYQQMINKIKMNKNKNSDQNINNSLKYKADFLVQNMVSSMKELIYLFENEININDNNNGNINMSIDNKSYTSFIQTENLDNFTQSSFSRENNCSNSKSREQYSELNSDLNNNVNNNYNDNSRNYKDREINFHSKY